MINQNLMYMYFETNILILEIDILEIRYLAKYGYVALGYHLQSYSCYRHFTSIEYQTLLAILY